MPRQLTANTRQSIRFVASITWLIWLSRWEIEPMNKTKDLILHPWDPSLRSSTQTIKKNLILFEKPSCRVFVVSWVSPRTWFVDLKNFYLAIRRKIRLLSRNIRWELHRSRQSIHRDKLGQSKKWSDRSNSSQKMIPRWLKSTDGRWYRLLPEHHLA